MNQAISLDEAQSLLAKAVELAGGDQVVALHLLEMIVETNEDTLGWLQESIGAESWESVASAAHRIVGSARMLESSELIALFTGLEEAARRQEGVVVGALLPLAIDALAKLNVLIKAALSGASRP
jgi:HPt (histidine-containing phosphotransfer) domain-containing protein